MSYTDLTRLLLLTLGSITALTLTLALTSGSARSRPATTARIHEIDTAQYSAFLEGEALATPIEPPPAPPAWAPAPIPLRTTVYWLFAHPDDESLSAGAAIREAQMQGHRNVVVVFSSGENTAVRRQLGLTREQTIASRQAETLDAMASIGITEVRFLGIPEGQITSQTVRNVIDEILATETGPRWFRGHSPFDHYLGLPCGHVDHCAIGNALLEEWREGRVEHLLMYRLGHLFREAREGICHPLTRDENSVKQRMRAAYAYNAWTKGRYGIGARSVPTAWAATAVQPECYDEPR